LTTDRTVLQHAALVGVVLVGLVVYVCWRLGTIPPPAPDEVSVTTVEDELAINQVNPIEEPVIPAMPNTPVPVMGEDIYIPPLPGDETVDHAEPIGQRVSSEPADDDRAPPPPPGLPEPTAPAIPTVQLPTPTILIENTSAPLATYSVVSGDTLSSIARRSLGSSARWRELLKTNRDVLQDPQALRPGMVLQIPGRPLTSNMHQSESVGVETIERPKQHAVKSGESLSSISRAVYGHSRHWRVIYQANRDKVSSPSRLAVGTTLTLPPLP